MTETTNQTQTLHPFEKAGLGRAPFRVIGVEIKRGPIRYTDPKTGIDFLSGSPGQPMGCCAYCATGIAECWTIESADGQRFIVGCVCVGKTGDARLVRQLDQQKRRLERAKRQAREKARRERVEEALQSETLQSTLQEQPHPNQWRASKGDSLLDWCHFILANGGAAGIRRVEKAIANHQS